MSLTKWARPKSLASGRSWIENFFHDTDLMFRKLDWDTDNDVPAVNVKEEENSYAIEVAAPGMKKEDFKVEVSNGVLSISAKSEDTTEEKKNGYVRREFSFRNFERLFWMPELANADKIEARYEDGVLKLSIPKLPVTKPNAPKAIAIS